MAQPGIKVRALQLVMGVTAVWWMLYWLLQPITTAERWLEKIDEKATSTFLGAEGSVFLMQALPIMVIALLSYFVIEIQRRRKPSAKAEDKARPKVDIWTLPIIVRSPLGMLTAGELLFVVIGLFVVCWFVIKSSVDMSRQIDQSEAVPGLPKSTEKLFTIAALLGKTALMPLALLWIPVSRGSPILRAIGIPFERAVKYHSWLARLALSLLTGHGVLNVVSFIRLHEAKKILTWETSEIAILPGVMALTTGILMLTTALERVRRTKFDLFFRVHQCYILFLLFFTFHAVSEVFYILVPVLLFLLDRFMRTVQSRTTVDVLSAKVLPSGAIELKFAKPASLMYHPLSFVYILLPSISRLQWHPFSVASSPLDGTNEMVICIKPLGGFTKKLHHVLTSAKQLDESGNTQCPFSFKVGLEGPYGSESAFYLRYKSLILVAGGIGLTPYLAIIRDILHRYKVPGECEGLPSSIHLIWCVRNPAEVHILDTVDPGSILLDFAEHVSIVIHVFVTAQVEGALETTDNTSRRADVAPFEDLSYINAKMSMITHQTNEAVAEVREMSVIASTGHNTWVAATVAATLLGFLLVSGIFNVTALRNSGKFSKNRNYVQALVYVLCTLVAVVLFGGVMTLLWILNTRRLLSKSASKVKSLGGQLSTVPPVPKPLSEEQDLENAGALNEKLESPWKANMEVTLGKRPNWKEIFSELVAENEGQDVGVMVSGAYSMQQDIARECMRHSLSRASTVILHYHSVSFEL